MPTDETCTRRGTVGGEEASVENAVRNVHRAVRGVSVHLYGLWHSDEASVCAVTLLATMDDDADAAVGNIYRAVTPSDNSCGKLL